MKINNHPYLYQKYKDKKIQLTDSSGIVVGYFLEDDKTAVLIIEKEEKDRYNKFNYFKKSLNIILKDYHGDSSKQFFLVNQSNFDKGFAFEIS